MKLDRRTRDFINKRIENYNPEEDSDPLIKIAIEEDMDADKLSDLVRSWGCQLAVAYDPTSNEHEVVPFKSDTIAIVKISLGEK